jgi:hypothetical protein
MTIEEAVFDYVSTFPAVTALVGAVDPRVYPKRLPQDPILPAIVFQMVSTVPAYTMDQAGDPPVATETFTRARFQFDLWTETYEGLLPLRDALFAGISGFRGMMGSVKIESVFVLNELDGFETDTESNRKMIDAMFSYQG